jgi:hypothetical protein
MRVPLLIATLFLFTIFSCSKSETSDGISPEDKTKAAAMITFLEGNKFQLKKYYSETPIDYIDTDQVVKAETDLWQYVSPWLHDDDYVFNSNGTVSIVQNTVLFPTDNSATLSRQYSVQADKNGVAFDFVGHEYQALKYRLIMFNDTLLKVSASWNGKTVISEFNTIN